jgi:hypothetical protein
MVISGSVNIYPAESVCCMLSPACMIARCSVFPTRSSAGDGGVVEPQPGDARPGFDPRSAQGVARRLLKCKTHRNQANLPQEDSGKIFKPPA